MLVEAALGARARGLISAGFPSGALSPAQKVALRAAAEAGVVVVQSSRSGSGQVINPKVAIRQAGFFGGASLTAPKARILLMLGLTVTGDLGEMRRIFASY